MSDDLPGSRPDPPASPEAGLDPTIYDQQVELLEEDECLRLIGSSGVGRLGYDSRRGVAVLPVRYRLDDGSIVFRTPLDSPTDEDLRTGIQRAEYKVSFEIDDLGQDARDEGWMVFVQGDAHHMDSEDDRISAWEHDAPSSASGTKGHFLRITPTFITGRRIRQT
jgi:nitroimidazol reductase NimA-like FMN-containing flavoprotein (pyridoxamine 5'-phosphate oxidase superfamily)